MSKANETKPEAGSEVTMADVLARMTAIMEQNAANAAAHIDVQREQLKQTRRPSNKRPPDISAFNPRGEKDFPMPKLKCRMLIPHPQDPNFHGCTREEVELLNRLEFGEYRVTLNDGTVQTANVIGNKHPQTGEITLLEIRGQMDGNGNFGALYSKDRFRDMPALAPMLRDMLSQKGIAHEDVLTMGQERELVKLGQLEVSVGE